MHNKNAICSRAYINYLQRGQAAVEYVVLLAVFIVLFKVSGSLSVFGELENKIVAMVENFFYIISLPL